MKVLYIESNKHKVGGRTSLSAQTKSILRELESVQLIDHDISPQGTPNFWYWKKFQGYIDGINCEKICEIINLVRKEHVDVLILSGSNLGLLAKHVKMARPETKVFTMFHNCEVKFFTDSLRKIKSLRAIGVLVANFFAEYASLKYSDKAIFLTTVDEKYARSIYRKMPKSCIIPLTTPMKSTSIKMHLRTPKNLLFVGSNFYSNVEGIRWFCRNVMTLIPYELTIIGRGMEELSAEFGKYRNVKVLGYVDDISHHYETSIAVVAPIFSGSGMKTKTIEAMAHGKIIFGHKEAFVGLEQHISNIGFVCNTPDEYVAALENFVLSEKISQRITRIHRQCFSTESSISRWKETIFVE